MRIYLAILLFIFNFLSVPFQTYAEGITQSYLADNTGLVLNPEFLLGFSEPQKGGLQGSGFQGGIGFSMRDKDRRCGITTCVGTWLDLSVVAGSPTLRSRLEFEPLSVRLGSLGFVFTPISARGMLTYHQAEDVGPDGSQLGNSFGFLSTRVGYGRSIDWTILKFKLGLLVGPEVGYIKDRASQAPFAGAVISATAGIDFLLFAFGANLSTSIEGHINGLKLGHADEIANHGLSWNGEFSTYFLPTEHSMIKLGFRSQVDLFQVDRSTPLVSLEQANGLSVFGGAFLRYSWTNGKKDHIISISR